MRIKLLAATFLICCKVCYSQIKPLQIDEYFPIIENANFLNQGHRELNSSEFSGKYLILKFWATWCSNCIHEMPKIELLQNRFINNLRFILVTSEPSKKIGEFVEKNMILRQINAPIITDDSILVKYFPHHSLPHFVWIDNKGLIIGITSASQITEQNIKAVLSGHRPRLPVKNDFVKFDYQKPAFSLNQENLPIGSMPLVTRYSSITDYRDGLARGILYYRDTIAQSLRVSFFNLSIPEMCKAAFRIPLKAEIKLQLSDSLYGIIKGELKNTKYEKGEYNRYCYEATFPLLISDESLTSRIVSDLSYWLGLTISLDKVNTTSLMTIRETNKPLLF